jgi:uncharacterized protein (DUF1684 family)
VGTLFLEGESVRLVADRAAEVTIEGQPVTERVLMDDRQPHPDTVRVGRLSLQILRRGNRFAARVRDPESPVLEDFKGIDLFPYDPAFRVEARLERSVPPRAVELPGVNETVAPYLVPGRLVFEIAGRPFALEPLVDRPEETSLFLIFADETNGHETYSAGRYLYATLRGDVAIVDFNQSYNPPCAFTPHATCPLPPEANRLGLEIRAGEKAYGIH